MKLGLKLNLKQGVRGYNPFISYSWTTKDILSIRYLRDSGTSHSDAELFFGRGVLLNGVDQSITIPINATVSVAKTINGVLSYEPITFITDYVISVGATYQNYIFYAGTFADSQKEYLTTNPEKFLYREDSILKSKILDQSEIDNIVAYLPMCETDNYVRDLANYSEGVEEVVNGGFDGNADGWNVSTAVLYGNNDIVCTDFGSVINFYQLNVVPDNSNTTTIVTFEITSVSSGGIAVRYNNETISAYFTTIGTHSVVLNSGASNGALVFWGNDLSKFNGTIDNVSVKKLSATYPITNYLDAVRDNAININKSLQTCFLKRGLDGVPYASSFDALECDSVGYALIPIQSTTVDITVTTYPYNTVGSVLSGNVSLVASGLLVGQDNTTILSAQIITDTITIGSGYSGSISIYKEDLI